MAEDCMKNDEVATFHQAIEDGKIDEVGTYIDRCPHIVHRGNKKGESALHIVCKRKNAIDILLLILQYSPDVNNRNFWGQTPLHYAASNKSLEMMKTLLAVEGIDVNSVDVNGYNAFHSLIMCGQTFDNDFKECIKILEHSNIATSAKTSYGHTVLHLAGIQGFLPYCCTEFDLLLYLLQFNSLDKSAKSVMGENFLHSSHTNIRFFELIMLIDNIYKVNEDLPKTLLNDKDLSGITPFFNMVVSGFFPGKTEQLVRMIQGFEASMKNVDNLGNTLLHYIIGISYLKDAIPYILKQLSFNDQNMFGETPLFRLKLQEDQEYGADFSYAGLNFGIRDRWGRTPLFNILNAIPFWHKLEPLLRQLEIDDINTTDNFGSTLLHLAAYLPDDDADAEQWRKVLIRFTKPSMFKVDMEGDIPFQTALKHGNFRTLCMIAKMMSCPVDPSIITYRARNDVYLSALELHSDIRDIMKDYPLDAYQYMEELLKREHVISDISFELDTEEYQIVKVVRGVVQKICDKVEEYDPRFKMTMFPTGSTSEGTKVGRPDEFDFGLCLVHLEDRCNIESVISDAKPYAKLKFRSEGVAKEYLSFCDEEYYLRVLPLLMYLYRYLRRALFERDIWADLGFLENLNRSREKPVFSFSAFWVGSKYKYLPISIDLVPVVYKQGWWPTEMDSLLSSKVLLTDPVRAAGCFVLMRNKSFDFNARWATEMNDDINMTCNTQLKGTVEDSQLQDQRLLLVSICPAEIALMKSLPRNYRRAYVLAKTMKSPSVCPEIVLDVLPEGMGQAGHWYRVVRPTKVIKSYWLKNCIFYLAEIAVGDEDFCNEKPQDITVKVYDKLLEFSSECSIHPYLLPQTDVFELEKTQEESTKEASWFLLERKACIDMVRKLLGSTVSVNNTEWLQLALSRYTHRIYTTEEESHFGLDYL